MRTPVLAGLLAITLLAGPGSAFAQNDRFGRFEPGLIVHTGARLAACDVLTFTPDGEFLLACGDDKFVPVWKFADGKLGTEPVQTLRWSIFREQKGSIYAMALSPDGAQSVAVGGMGVRVGAAAVIDRATGEVKHALIDEEGGNFAIWSLTFAPSGKRVVCGKGDGSVVLWDLSGGEKFIKGRHLGKHAGDRTFNPVRLVSFLREDQLISVAESGSVVQWNTSGKLPATVLQFDATSILRAAISMDHKWIAVANQNSRREQVEIRALDGSLAQPIKITLGGDDLPHCLAFDARRERLAVGVRTIPSKADFHYETDGRVLFYDLKQNPPVLTVGPKVAYYPEAVAFHPDGKHLAVAGGNNHEVTLWDLGKAPAAVVSTIRGPGSCMWGVGLANKGRYLGFQDERNTQPATPNDRGKGTWRVFDLQERKWATVPNFKPEPQADAEGWKVVPSERSSLIWYVVSPAGTKHKLPMDSARDYLPRCYTFLPRVPGKPLRLAVGHLWGVSIFELTEKEVRRSRVLVGHQGEVMALGISGDRQTLVSTGRDQTIAGWGLTDWPAQAELGVRFVLKQDKIVVDEVAPGSPGWESGLTVGDEVLVFILEGRELYDPAKHYDAAKRAKYKEFIKTPEECMLKLRNPVPGKEHYFWVKREGRKEPVELATTVRQRPLWRFFPTRNGEWVLWRWRDYFYDCSTNGDSFIGWQVNGDVDKTPVFHKAEQMRQRFYNPEKVQELLAGINKPEKLPPFPEIEPPDVRLRVLTAEVKGKDVRVNLTVRRRGEQDNQRLGRVLLWINDFHFKTWAAGDEAFRPDGSFELKDFAIPHDKLRQGENVLTLQCYNKAGGRGDALPAGVITIKPDQKPRLFGLIIGVGQYGRSELRSPAFKKFGLQLGDLNADRDAEAMLKMWQEQESKLFAEPEVTCLLNEKATPKAVLAELHRLAAIVKPDDRLVLFLAGHGISAEVAKALVDQTGVPVIDYLSPRSFALLGPEFAITKPNQTGITGMDLYEAIVRLNCHKLILLDACHAGAATVTVNPVRELTRDGVGPVILAACGANESALESRIMDLRRSYGLFTMAVRQALNEDFDDADKNHDGKLTVAELVDFVQDRVPELVQKLKMIAPKEAPLSLSQTPSAFLPRLERDLPWVKK